MKGKNLLLASLASVALMSCSQADSLKENLDGSKKDISLKISTEALQRAGVDIVAQKGKKTSINDGFIYFTNNGTILQKEKLDKKLITDLTSEAGHIFKGYSGDINSVGLSANKKPGDKVKEGFDLKNASWGEIIPLTIQDIQPAKGDGVSKAPMYGFAAKLDGDGSKSEEGNEIKSATVSVTPIIARVQVYGKIATNPELVEYVKVTRIFLDNFLPSNQKDAVPFTVKQDTGDALVKDLDLYKVFDQGKDLQGKTIAGKEVYAYHIFPQTAKPAVPVKDKNGKVVTPGEANKKKRCVNLIIEYKYKMVDGRTGTGYATLAFAKSTAKETDQKKGQNDITLKQANNAVNKNIEGLDYTFGGIKAATIYNIDLGKIDWNPDGKYVPPVNPDKPEKGDDVFPPNNGPDSTPNLGNIDLKVIVTPVKWTEETIIPTN